MLDPQATPPNGASVAPGQTILYVATLTNDDAADFAGITATDQLTVTLPIPANTTLAAVTILQQPRPSSTPRRSRSMTTT